MCNKHGLLGIKIVSNFMNYSNLSCFKNPRTHWEYKQSWYNTLCTSPKRIEGWNPPHLLICCFLYFSEHLQWPLGQQQWITHWSTIHPTSTRIFGHSMEVFILPFNNSLSTYLCVQQLKAKLSSQTQWCCKWLICLFKLSLHCLLSKGNVHKLQHYIM